MSNNWGQDHFHNGKTVMTNCVEEFVLTRTNEGRSTQSPTSGCKPCELGLPVSAGGPELENRLFQLPF